MTIGLNTLTMKNPMKHECGVAAVIDLAGEQDVVPMAVAMAQELQHRGELGAGIAWLQQEERGKAIRVLKDHGLVSKVLSAQRVEEANARGTAAIAHTRYATNEHLQRYMVHPYLYDVSGNRIDDELPPHPAQGKFTPVTLPHPFAFAFNGAIANADDRAKILAEAGYPPHTPGDTEVIGRTIIENWNNNGRAKMGKVLHGLEVLDGSFNIVMLEADAKGSITTVRDRHGFHPLRVGRQGSIVAVASEDHAIRKVLPNAKIKDVDPGHMIRVGIGSNTVKQTPLWMAEPAHCFFEPTYFEDHRAHADGIEVANSRYECGRFLALRDVQRPRSDIVVPVPESAKIAANGYSDTRGLRRVDAILKNRPEDAHVEHVGRTFTDPGDRKRKAELKYNIDVSLIRGQNIVLIDDSVVRGTTMKVLAAKLYDRDPLGKPRGAAEIHLRLASPAIIERCFYGIDFQTLQELVARKHSNGTLIENGVLPDDVLKAIAADLGVDSIAFLPVDDVPRSLRKPRDELCLACVTGDYPTKAGRSLHVLSEHSCKRC